jgi:phosphoheptose isomerase
MLLQDYFRESMAVLACSGDAIPQHLLDESIAAFASGRPLLLCGNGGSASAAMHTGEFAGR